MPPQKTLTLSLTGSTSTESVSNTIIVDVTLPKKWFLLRHEIGYGVLSTVSNDMGTKLLLPPKPSDYEVNPRILRESLRFADMTTNTARLLRILSLVQVSRYLEDTEFRKLVETQPDHFFTPTWYKGAGQGRSDLMQLISNRGVLF